MLLSTNISFPLLSNNKSPLLKAFAAPTSCLIAYSACFYMPARRFDSFLLNQACITDKSLFLFSLLYHKNAD